MRKVTLTLGQILDLDSELLGYTNTQTGEVITEGILKQELSLITKYHLEKLVSQTTEHKKSINKLKDDLIKKHGTQTGEYWGIPMYLNEVKDETGKLISADINPIYVTFNNEFGALLQEQVKIEVKELSIKDFADLKCKDYPKVLFTLLEEEEEKPVPTVVP